MPPHEHRELDAEVAERAMGKDHDERFYGGNYWQAPWPLCYRRLITMVEADKMALVSNPKELGSMLCTDGGGKMFYTIEELKVYLADWKHLGQFGTRMGFVADHDEGIHEAPPPVLPTEP